MPNSRDELFIGQKATLTRGGVTERVTVTPTHHRIPLNEVDVMVDVTGSGATVLVSQLQVCRCPCDCPEPRPHFVWPVGIGLGT